MAFPDTPCDVVYEIYVNGTWIDVTTCVYDRAPVTITRGRRGETPRSEPARCELTLDNDTGDFSPPNPVGAYHGSFGENTPLRVTIRQGADTFSRIVSNGWGVTDWNQPWTTVKGSGGTVQASDYGVGSGVGTMSVPVANGYRFAYLTGPYRNVDVAAQVTLPFTDVTGAALYPMSVLLRGVSDTDWVWAWVEISTVEAIRVGISHFDGTVVAPGVVTGLTHTAAQALMVRAQAEGHTYRAKVWAVGQLEPYDWHTSGHFTRNSAPGFVGLMNLAAAGNTNAKPIVASCDNLTIRNPRFAGELSDIQVQWDESENDVFTTIVAQGIRRRLGQGASPLLGAARRRINHILTTTVGQPYIRFWWPLEDGAETTAATLETALGGASPRTLVDGGGGVRFAAATDAPGAPAAVTVSQNGGVVLGMHHAPISTAWSAAFTAKMDAGQKASIYIGCDDVDTVLFKVLVKFLVTGVVEVRLSSPGAGIELLIMSTTVRAGGWADHDWNHYIVSAAQNGGNVNFTLWVNGAQVATATRADTLLSLKYVYIYANTVEPAAGPISVSHVVALTGQPSSWHVDTVDAISDACLGHRGERAGNRIARILAEDNIPFDYIGDLDNTPQMGPQPTDTLINILDQCADVDLGTLAEPCGDIGFLYRTRASIYTQTAILDLDYAAQHVAPPFKPSNDDTLTRNDIRVGRVNGAAPARVQLLTGRKSVQDPKNGGVGRCDDSRDLHLYSDEQTLSIAYWLLALGTVDEARWPQIRADLAILVASGKDIAALDVGLDDRVTVSNPFSKYTPDQISQLARGYAETIRNFTHRIDFNCAPESPYRIARVGATGHKVDAANSLLTGGPYSSGASSLTVATAAPSSPWITGSVTIDIMVAGEEMRVTNITGASSPQAFTVLRSRNGVVKGQVDGARVRLARPVKIGLGS